MPEHKKEDSIEQKEDTGKGLKVTISGRRIKIKASIAREKHVVADRNKKIPAVDSTKTDVAPTTKILIDHPLQKV